MNKDVKAYNHAQSTEGKEICNLLYGQLCKNMPEAENKIWHGHPVWFIDGNPIVGYSKFERLYSSVVLEWLVV